VNVQAKQWCSDKKELERWGGANKKNSVAISSLWLQIIGNVAD